MLNDLLPLVGPAFHEAIDVILATAVSGGLLAWGVYMGKLLGTGFFENPSIKKVLLISVPIGSLVATGCGLYSYRFVVDPGETRAEALQGGLQTFFVVLLALWTGCAWGILQLTYKADSPS